MEVLPAGAGAGLEQELAAVLAAVLDVDEVPVEGHFFEDLGADSMVMAKFCARVRKRPDLPTFSMRDVYQHPTLAALAAACAPAPPETAEPAPGSPDGAASSAADGGSLPAPPTALAEEHRPTPVPSTALARTGRHAVASGGPHIALCGFLQLVAFLGYTYASTAVALRGIGWVTGAADLVEAYLRAVVVGGATFAWACVFPVVAKWVLIGRFRPTRIRVWSLAYVRFWVVKTLMRTSPLARFYVGSPLHLVYLRALGAQVGRGVVVLSKTLPVCTDMLHIGDGALIRKDCAFAGYRAVSGVLETGPVTIGRNAFVGEATVLDIGTSLGDDAQLGHSSSLHEGQSVPDGESWHGSPARPCTVDHRTVEPRSCGGLRRGGYTVLQLTIALTLYLPLAVGVMDLVVSELPILSIDLASGPLTAPAFWMDVLLLSALLFSVRSIGALLYVVTVPRLLRPFVRPDRVYPMYGLRWSIHRAIARTTNSKFLMGVVGDSSYVVGYLQAIGYRLAPVVQTGSNFGTGVKHETPYLVTIGTGTMVADGLSAVNADFSSTSFRTSRVTIGPENFLGNAITYPTGGRTGRNVLLATKALVPLDGPVREDVGLLGSPPFEIPRTVERDARLLADLGDDVPRRLRAKNRHNLRTIGLQLVVRWVSLAMILAITLACAELSHDWGTPAMAAAGPISLLVSTLYGVLVERASTRFRPLEPRSVSIYDPAFWRHERFWKMSAQPVAFNGTPFKNVVWRLLGVKVGRGVFDDGVGMPERSLVTIGDGCTFNAGSTIQCHSQEDAGFKSDRVTLGAECTVEVGAWVHYGVTMGDGTRLAPDAFLMKGEQVPAGEVWSGNPAVDTGRPTRLVPWSPIAIRPAGNGNGNGDGNGDGGADGSGRHRAPVHRHAHRARS